MRRLATVALALLLAGCASGQFSWLGSRLAQRGDRYLAAGEYAAALKAYDEVLRTYPEHYDAPRVRLTRDTLAALVEVQAEVSRLRADLKKRQAELERITAEADKMRTDLERLKQIELLLERRRR